jgi:hypothetical protein
VLAQDQYEGCREDEQQDEPDDCASEFVAMWLGSMQVVFKPDGRAFILISRQGNLW